MGRASSILLQAQPGLIPLIGLMGPSYPHRSLQKVAKEYGPVFMLKLGFVRALVISSPDTAKEVLQTFDSAFASRPSMLLGDHLMKAIGFTPYGERFKEMRKICLTELFTTRRIDSFLSLRTDELSHMLSDLLGASKEEDGVLTVRSHLYNFTYNVMTRILMSRAFFGSSGTDNDGSAMEFRHAVEEAAKAFKFYIGDVLPPALRWLDPEGPGLKRIQAKAYKFLQTVIDEHKANPDERSTKDVLDTLVAYYSKDNRDDVIKAMLLELMLAGTDTSVTTTEWTLAELVHNPEALKKAQEELDSVVGRDRMVQESDFPKLEYVAAAIKESLRLHPPAAMLLPHFSIRECKVAGYDIPAGIWVVINAFAIARDPSVWENPLEFRPERFVGRTLDIKGQDFGVLPFGSGRRVCPGASLGWRTSYLATANLIHGFSWSRPPGHATAEETLKEWSGGITNLHNPLKVKLEPRLPQDAYRRLN